MPKPEELMHHAASTVEYYMHRGYEDIADRFEVEPGSPEHVELCKALLPDFVQACAQDFDTAVCHLAGNVT